MPEQEDNPRLRDLLLQASEIPEPEREGFLDTACGDEPGLRQHVQKLLAALKQGSEFAPDPTLSLRDPAAESPGTRIGRYKLVQLIGEGGFGSVFLAEQVFPVKRRVALKIIKLGMDTKQVIARFQAERQALAMMDHPNIAKVLEAGATETGRPYFVMELVEGVPVTHYCDSEKLTIKQRLELFVQVCQAVQHAHTKGIIHRDIKPSNMLVTVADGVAVPKVIDFGIAKATQGHLADRTLTTEQGRWMGTPQYMSPEQASGSADIDTRCDIYMLGVLLYELLTGSTPFDADTLASKSAVEIQRIICEVDPPRPSVRLGQLSSGLIRGTGFQPVNLMNSRAGSPCHQHRKLRQLLQNELDWIVMRCLEKDRNRRYQTASSLSRDVRRYLANEPVTARPAGRTYRVRKFVRRNRIAVLASAAVMTALLLGLVGTTIYAHQANLARVASDSAKRAAEVEGAERLISEGDALGAAARWRDAMNRYTLARQRLLDLGQPTLAADLGLWDAVRAIPVLNSFYPDVGEIECAEVFPDGRTAATGGKDGRLIIWDLAIARNVLEIQTHQGPVHALAISPDGTTIITGGEDGKAVVRNVSDGSQRRIFPSHVKPVRAVVILPDGRRVASGGDDGILRVWDINTAAQIKWFWSPERLFDYGRAPPPPSPAGDVLAPAPILSLAVSRDGKMVVVGSKDVYARVYDLENGKLLRELGQPDEGEPVACVALTPDQKSVLTGWGSDIVWWDRLTGAERTPVVSLSHRMTDPSRELHAHPVLYLVGQNNVGHTNAVNSLEFSPDGEVLLSAADDMTARLWGSGGQPMATLSDQSGRIAVARFFPTGNLALTAGAAMRVWDIGPGTELRVFGVHPCDIDAVGISPDGRLVLTGGEDGTARLFDVEGGRLLHRLLGHHGPVRSVICSPDDRQVLSASDDGTLGVWDVATGQSVRIIMAHQGPVAAAAVDAGWRFVVSAGADSYVRLWEIGTGRAVCTLGRHPAAATSAAVSPDGNWAVTGDAQGTLKLWDLKAGRATPLPMGRPGNKVTTLAFSPKGQRLLAGYSDGVCELWDTDGHLWLKLPSHRDEVRAVAFFSDGMSVASASTDKSIRIWDVSTGRELHKFDTEGYEGLAISSNGRFLVSGGLDRMVSVSDLWRPRAYADFEPRLRAAQAALRRNPDDPTALAEFGRWYALRHIDRWAIDLLTAARAGGADVPPLELAQCYFRTSDPAKARVEYRRALERREAPRPYLELQLNALPDDRSRFDQWLRHRVSQSLGGEREWEELFEHYGPTWFHEAELGLSKPAAPGGNAPGPAASTPATPTSASVCTPDLGSDGVCLGGAGAGAPFEEVSDGGVLTGLEVTEGQWEGAWGISSITPIFQVNGRRVLGNRYGSAGDRKTILEAKSGYAVAGVVANVRLTVAGFKLVFMHYDDGKLDPSDSDWSQWVGAQGGGTPERQGCDGQPIIGVYGRSAVVVHTLGFVQPDMGRQKRDAERIRNSIRPQIRLIGEHLAKAPKDAYLLFERAQLYMWLGQYDRAAADCDQSLAEWQDNESSYRPATTGAVVHLLAGDHEEYLRRSEQALQRFAEGTDFALIPICSTYLLAPRSQSDEFLVDRMARALDETAAPGTRWSVASTYGLAEYRRDHFRQAEPWFARSSEMFVGGPGKMTADLFRAMALERLGGRHEEALRLFQQVREVLQPSDPDALLRHFPRDLPEWLTALAAFKEAQSTIANAQAN